MLQLHYILVLALDVSAACISAPRRSPNLAPVSTPAQLPAPIPTPIPVPIPPPPPLIFDVPVPTPDIFRTSTPVLVRATVTAYSSSPDETAGDPFITASGRRVFDGLAACPRSLPFGTFIKIRTALYQCFDRLHLKYDNRFDIWMPTKKDALLFGKRRLFVEIIKG